jgi:hypothetical protein
MCRKEQKDRVGSASLDEPPSIAATPARLTGCREPQTMLARTDLLRPSTLVAPAAPGASTPQPLGRGTVLDTAQPMLALPFDALRQHYAAAVMAGIAPRSLRDSARVERWVDALEKLTLGPLARGR